MRVGSEGSDLNLPAIGTIRVGSEGSDSNPAGRRNHQRPVQALERTQKSSRTFAQSIGTL